MAVHASSISLASSYSGMICRVSSWKVRTMIHVHQVSQFMGDDRTNAEIRCADQVLVQRDLTVHPDNSPTDASSFEHRIPCSAKRQRPSTVTSRRSPRRRQYELSFSPTHPRVPRLPPSPSKYRECGLPPMKNVIGTWKGRDNASRLLRISKLSRDPRSFGSQGNLRSRAAACASDCARQVRRVHGSRWRWIVACCGATSRTAQR